jgi:hypothetical protein
MYVILCGTIPYHSRPPMVAWLPFTKPSGIKSLLTWDSHAIESEDIKKMLIPFLNWDQNPVIVYGPNESTNANASTNANIYEIDTFHKATRKPCAHNDGFNSLLSRFFPTMDGCLCPNMDHRFNTEMILEHLAAFPPSPALMPIAGNFLNCPEKQ